MNSLRALVRPRNFIAWAKPATLQGSESDPDTARKHARKARVILVTLARAFLGDAYLAALLETSETKLGRRLSGFYEPGTVHENLSRVSPLRPVRSYRGGP